MPGADLRRALGAALLAAIFGCSPGPTDLDRARLLGLNAGDPVQRALQQPARIVAVYWPAISCLGCQATAQDALARVTAQDEGIRVLTVIPQSDGRAPTDLALPGELVELPPRTYSEQSTALPAPRLEVWGDGGRELLLLRRLPPVLDSATLFEEIRSCLSFSSSGGPDDSRRNPT